MLGFDDVGDADIDEIFREFDEDESGTISRFELDIFERKLDPRRFRYLATQTVGVFTLILLSVIFIGTRWWCQ